MQQRGDEEKRGRAGWRRIVTFVVTTLVFILCDAPGIFRAWASPGERVALLVACPAILGTVYAFALAWAELLKSRWPLLAPAWVAGPPIVGLSLLVGDTHVGRLRLGRWGPVVAAFGLAAALFVVAEIVRRLPRRLGMALLLALCGGATVAQLVLPLRLLPSLRALLLVITFGAWAAAAGRLRSTAPMAVRWRLLATLFLILVSALFLRVSGNVRFIAFGQAPATGLVLSLIDRLTPSIDGPRAAVTAAASPAPMPMRTPAVLGGAHLVLITIDALRADRLDAATMPNLLRFAERGWRFRRAYAQAPHTAFSLSALLTARRPDVLPSCPETLPTRLRQRRWWTQAFYPAGLFFDGRSKLSCYAEDHFGFEWADTRTLPADQLTDEAIRRLDTLAERREPRAFLWMHYFDPHEPYEAHLGESPSAPPRARYDSEVRFVDAELGRLFERLERLERPVLVVVTGDHGEEFGEHGGAYHGSSLYDEQVRVPLVFGMVDGRMPQPGRTIEEPVELIDVVPTVASLLDLPAGNLLGRDLGLELERPAAHAEVDSRRMRVEGHYKLIHDLRRDYNQLYDLENDPAEQHNLFDERPEVAAPLHLALDEAFGLVSPTELVRRLAESPLGAERAGAARELGLLEALVAKEALAHALADEDERVRVEAALALGALGDMRAAQILGMLLDADDTRARAGLALGRLRDRRGVPALLEALEDHEPAVRRHAAHYLGFLADGSATRPLERAAEDPRVRSEAYVALGRLAGRTHDPRLIDWLCQHLETERQEDARAHLAWGVALSGARGSHLLSLLAQAAAADPPVRFAGEALERLGAISAGVVGGIDFAPGLVEPGLNGCRRKSGESAADFLDATTCVQTTPELRLHVKSPDRIQSLLFRARALGEEHRTVSIALDGKELDAFELGESFREVGIRLPTPNVRRGGRDLVVRVIGRAAREAGLLELDHLLLLP